MTSVVMMKTCSCINVTPRSPPSIAPRAVFTSGITAFCYSAGPLARVIGTIDAASAATAISASS